MKRFIPAIFAILVVANVCVARDPRRGYRGFVEWNNSIGRVDVYDSAEGTESRDADWFMGISTTHGYQFNNHCFAGLGFMLLLSTHLNIMLPLYADFRYDARFGKFTPFADIKIGYELGAPGVYVSPLIGYRFNCGGKVNFNLGMGMTARDVIRETTYHGSFWDNPPYAEHTIKKHSPDVLVTLRFGIDF